MLLLLFLTSVQSQKLSEEEPVEGSANAISPDDEDFEEVKIRLFNFMFILGLGIAARRAGGTQTDFCKTQFCDRRP